MKDARRLLRSVAIATAIAGASYFVGARRARAPGITQSTLEVDAQIPQEDGRYEAPAGHSGRDRQPPETIVDLLLSELGDQAVGELKSSLKRGLERIERVIDHF